MRLAADANVLFSALIRGGLTRRIWFRADLELYAPEALLVEALRHEKGLQTKFGGSREAFLSVFRILAGNVRFVPEAKLAPFVPAAASLIEDSKDWLYLACALYADAGLWSHDKGFLKQTRVKVWTTEELGRELGFL